MIRKLMVVLLIGVLCFLGTAPVLAQKVYPTLDEYERMTGKEIEKFSEAPMLRTAVAVGELPSVAERLPVQPLVIEPLKEIGQYGGTARCFTVWANTPEEGGAFGGMIQTLLHVAPDHKTVIPNIVVGWEFSKDGKVLTLHLREGLKWSDGYPATAEDVVFWWNDIILNDELTPTKPAMWCPGGKPMRVEKVDDYSVRFYFSVPYPGATISLASWESFSGLIFPIQPKHYLEKFHIKYNPKADKLAKENGFDFWYRYFAHQGNTSWGGATNIDLPTIGPFKLVKKTTDSVLYERNPYYWKIDTAGNQLPYVDKILVRKVASAEIFTGKIFSGEVDFTMLGGSLKDYTLFKENAKKAGYRVLLWPSSSGSQVNYICNQTYKEDPFIGKLFRDVRLRRALSLAINREEINDSVFHGLGIPGQWTVIPDSVFYEPEFAQAYAQYDPDEANRLLDEMGLKWDENHRYRLGPDGKKISWVLEICQPDIVTVCELTKEYWEKIGIEISIKSISGALFFERMATNMVGMLGWVGAKATDAYLLGGDFGQVVPFAHEWNLWYETGGKKGEEPPEEIKKIWEWREKMIATMDEKERIELGKKIVAFQAENLWQIGTVGMVPQPVIVRDNLENIPEKYLFGCDYAFIRDSCPEQYFFKQE